MMITLIESALGIVAVQVLICGWIGHALIASYRLSQPIDWLSPSRLNLIHIVFSPVAGLLLLYWVAELTLPFPQAKMPILVALIALSTWGNVKFIANSRASPISGIVASAFIGALAFLIVYNGQDMVGVTAHEYFPRTNGDTFSYLSHIEQFRFRPMDLFHPLERDALVYPAAYTGYYAPSERNGVSALGAFFANTLSLETHVAFFSTMRVLLIAMILGLLSILLLLQVPRWLAALCCLIYVFGCFYLHTVLQQFFSASAGVVANMAAIFCACLWVRSGYRRLEAFLAGGTLGLLLVYSPENFPTLLVADASFLFLSLVDKSVRTRLGNKSLNLLTFFGGGVTTALPLLFEPVALISWRLKSLNDYRDSPYTIEDYVGFGLHLGGLRSGLGRSAISALERITVALFTLVIVVGALWLFLRAIRVAISSGRTWNSRDQMSIYLSVIAATYVGIQMVYLSKGLTYPFVKTMDYFNFLPCIILALVVDWLVAERRGVIKITAAAGAALFSGMFIAVAIPAKQNIFSFYRANIVEAPPLASLKYSASPAMSVTGISPSMRGFSLELFYYVNRFRATPLEVQMADIVGPWGSYRYLQDRKLSINVSHRFCLGRKWNTPEVQKDCADSEMSELVPVTNRSTQ